MGHSSDAVVWALAEMRVPGMWDRGVIGSGVLVAVIDGGLDPRHPCFDGAVATELIVDSRSLEIRSASVDTPADHGTSVASLIAGRTVDGVSIGVAPGAQVVSVAALGAGDVLARVVVAMNAAADVDARVICLPMGTRSSSPIIALAARHLERRRAVLTVASSGNDGPGSIRSPADYGDVFSVGAHDRVGRSSERSGSMVTSGGRCVSPDVVAPGVDVMAAVGGGRIAPVTGTSFAVGYVAGVAALLRQAAPAASVAELRAAIVRGARPTSDDPRRQRSVAGPVDAAAALELLTGRRYLRTVRGGVQERAARPSVASLSGWIDPYLARLLDERSPDEPIVAVVGDRDADRIQDVVNAAQRASGVEPFEVVHQPHTGTAVVRASCRFVAGMCERAEADVISAARVPTAIPRRYAWR